MESVDIYPTPKGDYTVTTTFNGYLNGVYSVNSTADRNIITADVLDYDGNLGNYALIWKKVTITHKQIQSINAAGLKVCDTFTMNPWGCSGNAINYTTTDVFTATSSRLVEFYLTYKVKGEKFDKLLCSCTENYSGTLRVEGGVVTKNVVRTYDGTRVWGVSIQVSGNFIVYQFRKEIPSDKYRNESLPEFGDNYDSCYGLESWMTDKNEHYLWKLYSNVVGLINIADGVDSEVGYLKEEEYTVGEEGNSLSIGEVYSTGIVNIGGE
jgi:hypothetical protein